ncbi:unnamed protein product [Hyaloperonospora brassicae]|uniref:RxLR effector candidate protein n=1 Tax=Hyaloperonospora brassicae TaxID=162125 RepID=A0AAV0U2B4_HYABA|nr:unnamed protein product [Hyaloperonospora brassicae]
MSLDTVLTISLPFVVSVVVSTAAIALIFKLASGFFTSLTSLFERKKRKQPNEGMDFETGSAIISPAPYGYHSTWTTPQSKAFSPSFSGNTYTLKVTTPSGLCILERPPRSPRVMTSLVSPITTGCSPPKRKLEATDKPSPRQQWWSPGQVV